MYKLTDEQCELVIGKASAWLYDYCRKAGLHYTVVGSSGGLDSALTLALSQRACQLAKADGYHLVSIGITMPCESSDDSLILGREAIRAFGADEVHIDLTQLFQMAAGKFPMDELIKKVRLLGLDPKLLDTLYEIKKAELLPGINEQARNILVKYNDTKGLEAFDKSAKVAQGNNKARLRMLFGTYHFARMLKTGIVLSTDNLSEFWMAFWTICGDVGDIGMIQQMLKGLELYDLARHMKVPAGILKAIPDDGLGIGNGDADQIGATYPHVDRIIIQLVQQGFDVDGSREQLETLPSLEGYSDEVVLKVARRAVNGAFKRHGTYVLSRKKLGLPEVRDIKL